MAPQLLKWNREPEWFAALSGDAFFVPWRSALALSQWRVGSGQCNERGRSRLRNQIKKMVFCKCQ